MKLPVRVRGPARAEYADAVEWYDTARAGLGGVFEAAVEAVLDEASAAPDRFPIAEGDVREAAVSGFPYCVYYRVRQSRLIVLAVYHQSRDPSGWRGRA